MRCERRSSSTMDLHNERRPGFGLVVYNCLNNERPGFLLMADRGSAVLLIWFFALLPIIIQKPL